MSVSVILNNLLLSEGFSRKVIPHLQSEYFQNESDRVVFDIIKNYFHQYNKVPDITTIKVELSNFPKINEYVKKECLSLVSEFGGVPSDETWLIDQTEKFCQAKAVENALYSSIEILQDKEGKTKQDKGAIPKILSDALAISFDAHVGHDFIEDWNKRFDFYHRNEERIPFDIDYLNKITNGGLPRKTLNILMAGCVHPSTKVRIRYRKKL